MFYIPNDADATHAPQAQVDSRDWDILVAAFSRTWVKDGCLVSAQGTPNMTVAVAAGNVRIDGVLKAVVAVPSLVIGVADPVLGRFDLIAVNTSGVAVVVAGTASAVPAFPVIPSGRVAIASVYIAPAATEIDPTDIIDKRVFSTLFVHDVGDPPLPGTGIPHNGELWGAVDGVNKVYAIPEPYIAASFALYVGGIMIRPSDYTLSGVGNTTVTIGALVPAPQIGEWVGGTWAV